MNRSYRFLGTTVDPNIVHENLETWAQQMDKLRELNPPQNRKIVQLLMTPNDTTWEGVLLGLGSDGTTYFCDPSGKWREYIPPLEVK